MRVLLVSELLPPVRGGLEQHVAGLAGELAAQGHEVAAATLTRDPAPLPGPVYSIGGLAHALPHADADRPFHPPLPDPIARRRLARVLADFRPDVVHAHNWLAASLPRRRPPLVLTMHDYSLVCQLRTLYRNGECRCDGPAPRKCLSCGRTQLGAAKSALLTPATVLGRRALRPDAYVAVSSAVRSAVQPLVSAPIEVISNFVGAEAAREPLPDGFPTQGRIVLFAGDPGGHKGLDDLLVAWSAATLPGAVLVVATTRPIRPPGPASVFATSLSPGQMAEAWTRASVAVVPSRWAEPCPTVVLEAKRAGVPVIATDVGGIPDLVHDGVDGLLVAPNDPSALAAALERLTSDDALRDRAAVAARESYPRFAVGAVTGRILDVYRRVAAPA